MFGTPEPKHLYPIDPMDPLARAWNSGFDRDLVRLIAAQLPAAIMAVPICIGFSAATARTLLWVAVSPDSTTRETGCEAIRVLIDCITARGIQYADVEVFEGTIDWLAGLLDPADVVERHPELRRLTYMVGATVSPTAHPHWYGSSGCFVDVGSAEHRETMLLSCQHVFTGCTENASLDPDESSSSPVLVSHCVGRPFDTLRSDASSLLQPIKGANDLARFKLQNGLSDRPPSETFLQQESLLTERLAIIDVWADPEDHISGTLFAYPPIAHGFGPVKPAADSDHRWCLDYALIRLNPSSFQGRPINKMYFTIPEIQLICDEYAVPQYVEARSDADTVLVRCNTAAEEQPLHLSGSLTVTDTQHRRRVIVKHGAETGVTVGVSNGCHALARRVRNEPDTWSSQLVVIGLLNRGRTTFSSPGDSGSVAFDSTGAVLGIIDSPLGVDLTFVTPIEAILEDAKQRYGLIDPRVAAPRQFQL